MMRKFEAHLSKMFIIFSHQKVRKLIHYIQHRRLKILAPLLHSKA